MALSISWMPFPALSQTVLPAAGLSLPLYNMEGSARSTAMGSALVALPGDAAALMWNPAGLAGLDRMDLAAHHDFYFAGTFQETLIFGFPLDRVDGLAISANFVDWGNFDSRDSTGALLGSFTDTDTGLAVGWGREWWKGFSTGLSLRVLQQKVKDSDYGSLVGTLGLIWSPRTGWTFGAAYSNFGTQIQGAGNASDLTAGTALSGDLGKNLAFLGALSGDWENGGDSRLNGGLEVDWSRTFLIRLGYQWSLADNQLSGLSGLTTGAGIRMGDWRFDYAYLPSGDLGTSNRVSLEYQFGQPVQTAPTPVRAPSMVPTVQPTPVAANTGSSLNLLFKLPGNPGGTEEAAPTPSAGIADEMQAVQQNPQDVRAWWALGQDYFKQGKRDSAIQCFEQVLRLKPDNPALKQWLETYEKAKP